MNENELETLDSTNEEQEDVEIELEDDEQPEESEIDEMEVLRKENATLKAQKDHWKEKASKPAEPKKETLESGDLTTKDLYALMEAKVLQEDISEVQDYARLKSLPIAEALKSSFVKSLLKEKQEERKTALATHSGTARSTSKQLPDDVLVTKASKGELPESKEDIERLFRARRGIQ